MKSRWLLYLLVLGAGLAADLWTKSYFFEKYEFERPVVVIDGFFNIDCKYNPHFAFSLGPDNPSLVAILHLIAFGAIGYLLYHLKDGNFFVKIALALILAGAIGNLYDRMKIEKVRDFIDWHIGDKHWPTFNVADSMVSVGATIIVISLLFAPKEQKAAKKHGK